MIAYALIVAWLLPLLGFGVLVFFGRRIGEPRAGMLSAGLMIASAGIACASAVGWLAGMANGPVSISLSVPWVHIGDQLIDVGIRIDSLTIVMCVMVTTVASAIFVYSIGYMHGDPRFPRFFTYLNLFGFSMLGLVLAGSLIGLFIFWELVGACSYFLIGFWFEKATAANAAKKAFVVNRIGDFLFIVGIAVMLASTGSLTLEGVWQGIRDGAFAGQVPLLTFAGICLFFGAVGKSAQFPLHVWLPDAMEGPTPVSALIHAATMVAAGVYLVGRIFPLLTPNALLFIAYTGAITLFGSALIAVVMTDIKRVLAYSTISQLGYMMLALGVGGWVAGLFHLITHACFKALLFLGSGSVIHGCGGEQDIRKMGRLHRKMPITSTTFLIATLAIAGVPLLSGAYSKDAMLAAMFGFAAAHQAHLLLFILPAVGAALTAFYMMRLYLLTFHTTARDAHVFEHAHESPRVMWIPLVFLAVLSIGIGWFGSMPQRESLGGGAYAYQGGSGLVGLIARAQPGWAVSWQMEAARHPAPGNAAGTPHAASARHPQAGHDRAHTVATVVATLAMAAGFALAWLTYAAGLISAERAAARFGRLHRMLSRKFYLDELYDAVFVGGVLKLAAFGRWFDRTVLDAMADGLARRVVRLADFSGLTLDARGVDGTVNLTGNLTLALGNLARKGQTGRVRNYVLVLTSVVAALFLYIGIRHVSG
ncbi:MAG: NADH-quinone oxidoreductase subunit L [Desulfobacterales bacterium]|nr:NADH-quinone oxidoreductase subunit L [Desulfobacterales bacterium]